jgi:RimJ/RimL family protein N-acetyltransferase
MIGRSAAVLSCEYLQHVAAGMYFSGKQRMTAVLQTERLILRRLSTDDAAFILTLLNEPSWLQFIGDKGIRALDDARNYILQGPLQMYARLGFGLWLVELKAGNIPIGLCGLIKRDSLGDVDIGFAFLPHYWRQGYAFESAAATLSHGASEFGLRRLVAIVSPGNVASERLLEKLGFSFERMIRLAADADAIKLYTRSLPG